MSIASRNRRILNDRDSASVVIQCYGEVTRLSRTMLAPASDRRMNRLVDDLYDAGIRLAGAPSVHGSDLRAKITILCSRLREHLHPEHRGKLLNYMLAESLREDLRLLWTD